MVRQTGFASLFLSVLFLAMAMGAPAARAYTLSDLPSLDDEDEDPDRAFRDSLNNSATVASGFFDQTENGKNVSEIALGMFVSKLLGTLSGRDKVIAAHIFAQGRFTEGYLIEVFQHHSNDEVDYFTHLSQTTKDPQEARLSAAVALALDCLRHIPDSSETDAVQAKDRGDLARSLASLRSQLSGLAATAVGGIKPAPGSLGK